MTGVASNVTLSIGKLRIDVTRHRQHHARGFLLGIIVTRKIALHVTERALYAERGSKRTHRHDNLLSTFAGQNLEVLRGRWRALFSFFFLGAEADWDKQQHNR